jgi:hypothetical protein
MNTPVPKKQARPEYGTAPTASFGRPLAEPMVEGATKIGKGSVLDAMKEAWGKCSASHDGYLFGEHYAAMLDSIKELECCAKDVEAFSVQLAEFQHENEFPAKAGLFLSALINNSKDTVFTIQTYHLHTKIDVIGYRNRKDIVVNGGAGHCVGREMKSGTITVNGNVGECLGDHMSYGKITVNGNAGMWVGDEMDGGELRINGRCSDISPLLRGGKVYFNGELLLSK